MRNVNRFEERTLYYVVGFFHRRFLIFFFLFTFENSITLCGACCQAHFFEKTRLRLRCAMLYVYIVAILITRWCCIPTTHVVEWMCASCSRLIKCVGKRIRMMIRFWHWSRNVNRFWSTRVNRFEVRACVLSRSVLFSTEELK